MFTNCYDFQGQTAESRYKQKQALPEDRSSSMEVFLVRAVEKLLDNHFGRLQPTPWSTPLTAEHCLKVLKVTHPNT